MTDTRRYPNERNDPNTIFLLFCRLFWTIRNNYFSFQLQSTFNVILAHCTGCWRRTACTATCWSLTGSSCLTTPRAGWWPALRRRSCSWQRTWRRSWKDWRSTWRRQAWKIGQQLYKDEDLGGGKGRILECCYRAGDWLLLVWQIAFYNSQWNSSQLQNVAHISVILLNNSTKLLVSNKHSLE